MKKIQMMCAPYDGPDPLMLSRGRKVGDVVVIDVPLAAVLPVCLLSFGPSRLCC
jgi:hypothetical protein